MEINDYINHEWDEFDLLMTEDGFSKCDSEMQSLKRQPQVYIHVGNQGKLTNKVPRIGVAKSGTYRRFITNNDGHMHTFFWSIGLSQKYTEERALDTSNYMIYFANLYGLKTKLYVLSCESYEKAREAEKAFISGLKPIWEKFKKAHKVDEKFPILTTKNKNIEVVKKISKCGGAIRYLVGQRNNAEFIQLPEIQKWNIENHGEFELQKFKSSQ